MLEAITTNYAGCAFRSRAEARAAVFFEAVGLQWEYEKEGYELGPLGRYLPDFWLPECNTWVEIKGAAPDDEALLKLALLCFGTKAEGLLLFGGWSNLGDNETAYTCGAGECLPTIGSTHGALRNRLKRTDGTYPLHNDKLHPALVAARSARFDAPAPVVVIAPAVVGQLLTIPPTVQKQADDILSTMKKIRSAT